jgi:protein tyrosine phosphatase (PTP) superfamily phosphohydrolase (DUF442 family)
MDAPPPNPPPRPPRVTRRGLFRLAGGAVALGFGAEVLRVVALTNVHTVVPGRVYRTAQLKPEKLQKFIADNGIRTVVNLRGVCANVPWYLGECRTTHAANVNQEDITFSAKRLPAPAEVRRLIDVLDHTEYPVVLHCQRGADRTGLASTVARLLLTDDTLAEAERQLWLRFGHLNAGRTAVIDRFFDYYEAWLAGRGEPHSSTLFRTWVREHYCPGPYRAALSLVGPSQFKAGKGFALTVRAANVSVEPWRFSTGRSGAIRLAYGIANDAGETLHKATAGHVSRVVAPGEAIEVACGFPPLAPGSYAFRADLVQGEAIELLDTAFVQYGSEPLSVAVAVG